MQQQKALGLILLVGSMLAACSSNPVVDEKRAEAIQQCKQQLPVAKKIQVQSISFSCMASMAFSKAIGSNNPAPMLCMAGGAGGFLFGESIAERKCGYATLEDQVRGEIAHAKKMNAGFDMVFIQQEQELAGYELMAAGLRGKRELDAASRAQLTSLEGELSAQVEKDQAMLKQARDEFRFKQKTLAEGRNLEKRDEETALMAEIKVLQKYVKRLQDNNEKLTQIRQSLSTG